jgi:hypothetical protein
MDKEEIKDYLKRVDELEAKLTGEDKETYAWLIYGYNQCAKLLNETEQQCKKQKDVINKAIKLIKYNERYRNEAEVYQFVDIVSEILNPLQNILEQDETTNNAYLKEFEDWLKEVSE